MPTLCYADPSPPQIDDHIITVALDNEENNNNKKSIIRLLDFGQL